MEDHGQHHGRHIQSTASGQGVGQGDARQVELGRTAAANGYGMGALQNAHAMAAGAGLGAGGGPLGWMPEGSAVGHGRVVHGVGGGYGVAAAHGRVDHGPGGINGAAVGHGRAAHGSGGGYGVAGGYGRVAHAGGGYGATAGALPVQGAGQIVPVNESLTAVLKLDWDAFAARYPEYNIVQDNSHRVQHQLPVPEATELPSPTAPLVDQAGQTAAVSSNIPSIPTVVEGDSIKSHTRQASQDINPTPTKRVREDGENTSPDSAPKTAPSSTAPVAPPATEAPAKKRPGRPRKPKAERAKAVKAKAEKDETAHGEAKTNWSDAETTKLMEALFGTQPFVKFEKFEKNPDRYCKKIAKHIFKKTRSWKAIKSRYTRMRTAFTNILTFESWTGGDSDPDLRPPPNWKDLTMDEVETRFEQGRRAGKEYGELTAAVYKKWQAKGWYDYFNTQLSARPNLVRPREHNAEVLSDMEHEETARSSDSESGSDSDSSSDSDSDVDSEIEFVKPQLAQTPAKKSSKPLSKTSSKAPSKTPSKPPSKTSAKTPSKTPSTPLAKQHGVPENKHGGKHSSLAAHAGEFMESNSNFLKAMQASNEGQLALATKQFEAGQERHDRRLALDERRLEAELALQQRQLAMEERRAEDARLEARMQEARRIVADPASPPALKDAATELLMKYLLPTS